MSSSSNNDPETFKIADPHLFGWRPNAAARLKREVRRGYAKFWAKRGMKAPSENFNPHPKNKPSEGSEC